MENEMILARAKNNVQGVTWKKSEQKNKNKNMRGDGKSQMKNTIIHGVEMNEIKLHYFFFTEEVK